MTLYQKYRPKDFSEIVGNEITIKALENALKKENHSHVYLFVGQSGTGKTTAARIMASKLDASELDIVEINSSNNRGIDTAREIIQQMKILPIASKNKVFILDEVQKTTADFQGAILKALEDTPEYVYFFLCTTDAQKLIKPIKTRCTLVEFNLLTSVQLYGLLNRVCKLENVTIPNSILTEIAEKADGCPRAALVLLERILALSTEDEMKKYLKSVVLADENDAETIELCRALLKKEHWNVIANILKQLNENGVLDNPEKVRYTVLSYMNTVLLSGKENAIAMMALEAFSQDTFNTGKAGITLACLKTIL